MLNSHLSLQRLHLVCIDQSILQDGGKLDLSNDLPRITQRIRLG